MWGKRNFRDDPCRKVRNVENLAGSNSAAGIDIRIIRPIANDPPLLIKGTQNDANRVGAVIILRDAAEMFSRLYPVCDNRVDRH